MRRATEEWGHGIKFVGCADGFVWLIERKKKDNLYLSKTGQFK